MENLIQDSSKGDEFPRSSSLLGMYSQNSVSHLKKKKAKFIDKVWNPGSSINAFVSPRLSNDSTVCV